MEWVLNPAPRSAYYAFDLNIGGAVITEGDTYKSHSVKPVTYLKHSTIIFDAAGTPEDPFVAS